MNPQDTIISVWDINKIDMEGAELPTEKFLPAYRLARWLLDNQDMQAETCRTVVNTVDAVIASMRCAADRTVAGFGDALQCEFCDEQRMPVFETADKLGISKSAYYDRVKSGTRLANQLIKEHIVRELICRN